LISISNKTDYSGPPAKEMRQLEYLVVVGIEMVLDVALLATAFGVAYLLRFDFEVPPKEVHGLLVQLPYVVLLQFLGLMIAGARAAIWRYTGMAQVKPFLAALFTSALVVGLLRLALPPAYQAWRVPLSVNLIDHVLAFGGTLGLRVLRRALFEYNRRRSALKKNGQGRDRRPVLLIGAGQAGVLAAKEIEGRGDLHLEIKGFVDDDRMKLGRSIAQGRRVLGTTADLPRLVRRLGIDHVVITIAEASRQQIQRIVKICEEIPIKVRIIPGLYELLDGRVEISRIRDVQIEDLLGREPVQLDLESIRQELGAKTVMVTGAGGSIGAELARQARHFAPARLLLVERAEFALFDIEQGLREANPALSIVPLVADVGDEARMRAIFDSYQPQVVIHAAAHKHVSLMESNPSEAIRNNVLNTRLLGQLAGEYRAEVFVLVSTDKAVRPASVMGASKRLAELVVQDLNRRYETRFVAVRFGNVIGSAGSVVPIFKKQIRNGGPMKITDRRMKRYFMSIPEAAQLVLQASAIGQGGEVFALDMGEPVRIMDLAETLIKLSGLKPHEDIKIVETGIRPGEKLYEELSFESEDIVPTSHPKIFVNKLNALEPEAMSRALARLAELCRDTEGGELREFLRDFLPESCLNGQPKKAPVEPAAPGATSAIDTPGESRIYSPADLAGRGSLSPLQGDDL
jgi:FlaA1/EpsC-like NDP-sugar epimerase